jgi:protein involved in polysaccharide export with SLBB domain
MPSFLRFASVAAVLLAVSITGRAQGIVGRPVTPAAGYGGGIPATGGQAGIGFVQPGAGMVQDRMQVVDPDKKLAAGDQVTVEIVEDRDGGFPRVVTATGELDVPPLGRVRVSGKTAAEAAAELKTLLERDYYYHATVRLAIDRVSPVAVRTGEVYLSGEVRAGGPQEMIAGETLTLTNAVLRAGGIGEWGNADKVQITRLKKDGTVDKMTVSFKKIIKSGDAKQDPVLQDGDRIFVPKIFFRTN